MDTLTVGAREQAGVTYTTVTHPLGAASCRRSGRRRARCRSRALSARSHQDPVRCAAGQPLLLSLLCHLTVMVKR